MKISMSSDAKRRCLGMNNENCSCRPSVTADFRSGIGILSRIEIFSLACSLKRCWISVPMSRKRSVKNELGTSNTLLSVPFSTKTGSCGRSNSNNRFSFLAMMRQNANCARFGRCAANIWMSATGENAVVLSFCVVAKRQMTNECSGKPLFFGLKANTSGFIVGFRSNGRCE